MKNKKTNKLNLKLVPLTEIKNLILKIIEIIDLKLFPKKVEPFESL